MRDITLTLFALAMLFGGTQALAAEVTPDDARRAAGAFLCSLPEEHPAPCDKRIGDATAIRDRSGRVLAYVHQNPLGGYVVTSADTRLRPVVSYSADGYFPAAANTRNPLRRLLAADLRNRLGALDMGTFPDERLQANTARWRSLTRASAGTAAKTGITPSATTWGPWLTTEWNQKSPYNDKCPKNTTSLISGRRPVGCTATGIAQIVNYWEWPSTIRFGDDDRYDERDIAFDADASRYDFPTFSELNRELATIEFDGDEDELAYLCFGLGVKLEMAYTPRGSGSDTLAVRRVLLSDLGYGSATADWDTDGVWDEYRDDVIRNMKDGLPAQIAVLDPDPDPDDVKRHSVVVDGYDEATGCFHVNFGWADLGDSNAWYDLPESYGGYDTIYKVVYDISPSNGWGQERTDAKNSARVRFGAPESTRQKVRWKATCPLSYSFGGVVVGRGARSFATCNPNVQNDGNDAELWVIDWDGQVARRITLEGEDNGLEYPALNSRDEVFVATTEGRVYRVDPNDGDADVIFTTPAAARIEVPLKIDERDRIYVATADKLHCLSRTGTPLWTTAFSTRGDSYISTPPAIDSANDRVFLAYHDSAAETSHLSVIDAGTGLETEHRDWLNVDRAGKRIRTPVLDTEGLAYISVLGSLYVVDADDELRTQAAWDCPGSTPNPAAMGRDDRIYVTFWEQSGSTWYRTLSALDADFSTGEFSQGWRVRFDEEDEYDDIRPAYFAANDVVVFTLVRENGLTDDTHTLFAYRDNGTSASKLWERELGEQGGAVAFAPDRTVITLPTSGDGEEIVALTDSDRLGEGWAENARPDRPTNTGLDDESEIDTDSVTLRWDCTDDDGHDLTYDVFFGEDDQIRFPVVTGLTTTSYTVRDLDPGRRYLWRVVASDGQAVTDGDVWAFSTADVAGGGGGGGSGGSGGGGTNTPPVFVTDPTASVSLAAIDEDVTFSTTASDADGDVLTYEWDFGDGTTARGAQATHRFADAGEHLVTVRVSDSLDIASREVSVHVGRGFSPIKLKGKVSFKTGRRAKARDTVLAVVDLPLPAEFDPNGSRVSVDVGGVDASFVTNRKGKAKSGHASVRLKYSGKRRLWRVTLRIKKGAFTQAWAQHGIVNETVRTFLDVPITISIDGETFKELDRCYYKAKEGKSGLLK